MGNSPFGSRPGRPPMPAGSVRRVRHPLLDAPVMRVVERAASAHSGQPWACRGFTDRSDRAAHPAGIFHGQPFSVFAKLNVGAGGREQFAAELAGLDLLRRRAEVATPAPVAAGLASVGAGTLLLFEALQERTGEARSGEDFRSIGRTLAALHQVRDERFGLTQFDGFFGPLLQDNRPVGSNRWADYYAQRRIAPLLRTAVDSGNLPLGLAAAVERLLSRLPAVCGPEPWPSLLHGDAQQNNFVAAPSGAVVIDVAPYFGHPEVDLAQLDVFAPVPPEVFDGYSERAPIDPGFSGRRELWRVYCYLAVVAVAGPTPLGCEFLGRLADAIGQYQ